MANVKISPSSLKGKVVLPASKSVAHRALICAALSGGTSEIKCDCTSRDINATVCALKALGAKIKIQKNVYTVSGIVPQRNLKINCFESGSTARFLLPVAAALGVDAQFIGEGRLPERPFDDLCDVLRQNGVNCSSNKLPIDISGVFSGERFVLPGNVSSQYVSGVLLAAPLMNRDVTVQIKGTLESEPYVDITIDVMSKFGVKVQKTEDGYFVKGGQNYISTNVKVESDWSAAAFFMSAAAIGGEIALEGLNFASSQGDMAALDVFAAFGAEISIVGQTLFVKKGKRLRGISVEVSQIPDMVPAIAVTAAFADGETKITGAARLRLKESDRIKAVCNALKAMGVSVAEDKDGIIIKGSKVSGGKVDGVNDHRIVMAFSIAANFASGETEIKDSQAVSKSYPEFFRDFEKIGGKVNEF